MSERIGILGVGHFGGYLVEGLSRGARSVPLVLSPRNAGRAAALAARHGCAVAASNQDAVDRADVVLLATRPDDAAAIVASLRWRKDQVLVSFCGGVSRAAFSAAPATVVRAMASAAVAAGESTVVVWPEDARVRSVLERLGPVLAMADEETLESGTVMYGYYAMLFGVMAEGESWAEKHGIAPDAAREIVGLAFRGAGLMRLRDKDLSTEDILRSLATPGGLTERGLAVLEKDGALKSWGRALDAVLRRIKSPKRP